MLLSISRSRAAQTGAEQSFGGAERLPETSAPVKRRRVVRLAGPSGRLHFLLVRFICASKENEHFIWGMSYWLPNLFPADLWTGETGSRI